MSFSGISGLAGSLFQQNQVSVGKACGSNGTSGGMSDMDGVEDDKPAGAQPGVELADAIVQALLRIGISGNASSLAGSDTQSAAQAFDAFMHAG